MEHPTDELPLASVGQRILAWLIDWLVVNFISVVYIGVAIVTLLVHPILFWLIGVPSVLAGILSQMYLTWGREGSIGASYGKTVMGIWVIDQKHGGPVGIARALGRQLLRIGALTVPLDGKRRGLHDHLFGSIVTQDTRAEQQRRYMETRTPVRMQTPTGWATGYLPASEA